MGRIVFAEHFNSLLMSADMFRSTTRALCDAQTGEPSSTNAAPVRLVVLNACSLAKFGDEFVNAGVPHVICSTAELRDSASHVFLCALSSHSQPVLKAICLLARCFMPLNSCVLFCHAQSSLGI